MSKHPIPAFPATTFSLPVSFFRNLGVGSPVPASVRRVMEKLLKTSFAATRIYITPEPALLRAAAFAHGENVCLSPDCSKLPYRQLGRLLAHELTHVAQQRKRAMRNPFGGQVAVIRDAALEDEAEWHADRAAEEGFRPRAMSGFSSEPIRASAAVPIFPGSYRIEATVRGRHAGTGLVHELGRDAVELTDLRVLPAFRGLGAGRALVRAAADAAIALRKSWMILGSQDNGAGSLTTWYEKMGFVQTGWRDGNPRMKASVATLARHIAAEWCLPLRKGSPAPFAPVLQCADDDARRQARMQRFAAEHNAQAVQDQQRQATINHLRAMVAALKDAILAGSVQVFASGGRVGAHGYNDPASVFVYQLRNAAWNQIEAEWSNDGNKLTVTIRFGNRQTVTGSYTRFGNSVQVFHCGETTSGVGYGTLLG